MGSVAEAFLIGHAKSGAGGMLTEEVSRGRERTGNYRQQGGSLQHGSGKEASQFFRNQCLSCWFKGFAEVQ